MLWLLIQWILFLVLFLALGYLTCRIILWFWSLLKEIMNPPISEKKSEPDSYEQISHDSQDN